MKSILTLALALPLFTNGAQAEVGRLFLTPEERLAPATSQAQTEPEAPPVVPETRASKTADAEAPQASGWIRAETSGKTLRWIDGALREDTP